MLAKLINMLSRKRIGIFSKFDMSGGSEMRCVELANSIARHTKHIAYLFCENNITDRLRGMLADDVELRPNLFRPTPNRDYIEELYELDCLVVVCSDSRNFTTLNYWQGKTEKHNGVVDLTRMKQIMFLFNYLISSSKTLPSIESYCPNIKIITTNSKFYNEISQKIESVCHLPRIILESPINPDAISPTKTPSKTIRIGMHSKPVQDKWNSDWAGLIEHINGAMGNQNVQWRFLGCPNNLSKTLSNFDNVTCHPEFSIEVKDYLRELDLFVFFPSYKREEPWSRVVAEALTSGCPVIATKKGGNLDQVIHGNTGFLCDDLDQFKHYVLHMCHNRYTLQRMSQMCMRKATAFSSKSIVNKLVDFMEW